jgi:hypothetical protein
MVANSSPKAGENAAPKLGLPVPGHSSPYSPPLDSCSAPEDALANQTFPRNGLAGNDTEHCVLG